MFNFCNCFIADILSGLISSVKPMIPATPLPKLTTTLCFSEAKVVHYFFSFGIDFMVFDKFKFAYVHGFIFTTKHFAIAPFPILLSFRFVWFKTFSSINCCYRCSENSVPAVRSIVLREWFRLVEKCRKRWDCHK
jgi:hypothetical protein